MSKWRPQAGIQIKVIGICIDRDRLLAMDVYTDRGRIKGVRPLGGHIEFGETREDALRREFLEELGSEIEIGEEWFTFENIYRHHGKLGHEYIFATEVALCNTQLRDDEILVFSEDSGSENTARWHTLESLRSGTVELYPNGLLALLR